MQLQLQLDKINLCTFKPSMSAAVGRKVGRWTVGRFHIEIVWLKLKLNHLAYGTVAVGRELVLGDNGLSKGKCTTDHYEGFAPELHQTFEKEQIARFPLLPYFNTS